MTPRSLVFAMCVSALLWALIAAAALAQSFPPAWPPPRMSVEPGDGACVAYVRIENRMGVYNTTEALDVQPWGEVAIRYETIGAHAPGNDDRITVVSLPPSLAADPMEATIVDGDTLAVCLYEPVTG